MSTAAIVANYILDLAEKEERAITPLQLMKLVYMCHGWKLGLHGEPLIREPVEAWQYGPVISSLYHRTKDVGSAPLGKRRVSKNLFDTSIVAAPLSANDKELIGSVYAIYSRYSGAALSNLTHKPGSPWFRVWKAGSRNLVIPNDLIRQHYAALSKKDGVDAA